jgi:hypothetical protein
MEGKMNRMKASGATKNYLCFHETDEFNESSVTVTE